MADPDRRTWLLRLLEDPEARPRVRKAVASLLGVTVVSIGALGALVIWHLVRRGRLIQQRLGPPRDVRLPDPVERRDDPEPGPSP